MTPQKLARQLLKFLNQKEDRESAIVRALFISSSPSLCKKIEKTDLPTLTLKKEAIGKKVESLTQEQPSAPPEKLSIYTQLSEKIKKSCPDLRIKDSPSLSTQGVPDCDVLFLTLKKPLPAVYQALISAIDKQLALTEAVGFDLALMGELKNRHFKAVLITPELKAWPLFKEHLKKDPLTGKTLLGSSVTLSLEDPEVLNSQPTTKQVLWKTLKSLLVL